MAEVLKTLLALSLGGSMMALLLYGLKLCLGWKLSSSVYYYLWLLVLLRFIIPVPGIMPTNPVQGSEPTETMEYVAENFKHIRDYTEPSLAKTVAGVPEPDSTGVAAQAVPGAQEAAELILRPVKKLQATPLLFALWIFGAAVYLLHSCAAYLRFSRAVRRNAASPEVWEYEAYRRMPGGKKPRLMKSPYVSTPMLMGILSPCLILPKREYDEETLYNIFLHELKHFSRRDLLYKHFALLYFRCTGSIPLHILSGER